MENADPLWTSRSFEFMRTCQPMQRRMTVHQANARDLPRDLTRHVVRV